MEAKKDRYLNCLEQPPQAKVEGSDAPEEDEAPEVVRPEGALFAEEEFGPKVEKPKKEKRKPKNEKEKETSGFWEVIVDKMGVLFDGMVNEENEA